MTRRPVHLAVEVRGAGAHPGAWRAPDSAATRLFSPAYHLLLAQLAHRGGLDVLFLPDSFVPPGDDPGLVRGALDAVAVAARVAPAAPRLGIVATATVTHTEPFHLSKAIATLDFVSSGFAGWQPDVSRTAAEADLFGRKAAADAGTLWREADEAVEVVTALWDSWEDDAEIRDVATGRFVDRDKLHPVGFRGEFFSVAGASITPRPPQGHPLVVLRADEPEALAVAARRADVVRISATHVGAAVAARTRIRDAVAAAGRDPDTVGVWLDVEVLVAPTAAQARERLATLDGYVRTLATVGTAPLRFAGTPAGLGDLVDHAVRSGAADGITLVPLALPGGLEQIVHHAVPHLVGRGLRPERPHGSTLRERLGLARPANVFEKGGVPA
ncbi:monooxygenase [Pseudonocardia sulfidoxydans NBRC 16205]|uniref:Monooxygenase n=1 Tax=Pseudonocardia sulfidoxydans NBRC 16205 TaxID=1223511 RepID=A0A511DM23_9PSEU|nr:LLM class flavin-dependent oxidoreductase [Pseudonocardia sulfidoxydans]GEL25861.1 monooxygenase [Pseudonocardia sulfidoxydans NBRC 16205]